MWAMFIAEVTWKQSEHNSHRFTHDPTYKEWLNFFKGSACLKKIWKTNITSICWKIKKGFTHIPMLHRNRLEVTSVFATDRQIGEQTPKKKMSAVCVLLTIYSGEEQNKNLLTPSLGRFQPTRIILALFAENMHSRGNKRIMTFNSGSLQSHVCWIFHTADVNFSCFCLRKLKAVKFVDLYVGGYLREKKKKRKNRKHVYPLV